MSRNGSGTYAVPNTFVPGTTISSADHNENFEDLGDEITNSVAADGQTTMTGPLKAAAGTAAAPALTFAADPDSGLYRSAANEVSGAANGVQIFKYSSAGLDVVEGTFRLDGVDVFPLQAANIDDDAVTTDKIDDEAVTADKLGPGSVTAAKVADSFIPRVVGMLNGTIVASNAASALTIAVKTLAGADPSSSDPVKFVFRNATAGTGNYVIRNVTAALSITIPSTATMGFTNSTPGRIWLIALDNAGTVELAVINCLSGINIYPLAGWGIITTTSIGTGADSAHVPYSTTGRTDVAYFPLGNVSYEAGSTLATAGTWNANPTRSELVGPGVPLPGETIQRRVNRSAAASSALSTTVPLDNSIPQSGEGTEWATQAITPRSSANLLNIRANMAVVASGATRVVAFLLQDSGADALASDLQGIASTSDNKRITPEFSMIAGTLSSTTFKVRVGPNAAVNIYVNADGAGTGFFNGTYFSYLAVEEIAA